MCYCNAEIRVCKMLWELYWEINWRRSMHNLSKFSKEVLEIISDDRDCWIYLFGKNNYKTINIILDKIGKVNYMFSTKLLEHINYVYHDEILSLLDRPEFSPDVIRPGYPTFHISKEILAVIGGRKITNNIAKRHFVCVCLASGYSSLAEKYINEDFMIHLGVILSCITGECFDILKKVVHRIPDYIKNDALEWAIIRGSKCYRLLWYDEFIMKNTVKFIENSIKGYGLYDEIYYLIERQLTVAEIAIFKSYRNR